MTAIVIFAKAALPGIAKTRIAKTEGSAKADQIYLELLTVTAKQVQGLDFHVAFTGSESHETLQDIFSQAHSFFIQQGEGLGERLRSAFEYLFQLGYDSVIAIGCDCPYLSSEDMNLATKLLKNNQVVIGPATDGGYYLIGAQQNALAIFSATQWSSAYLFDETMNIITQQQLSYTLLETRADIDTMDDYLAWRKSLE